MVVVSRGAVKPKGVALVEGVYEHLVTEGLARQLSDVAPLTPS